ncbi:MAG: hypothetical protein M0014_02665 [Actinomycetota bacterium]|jgi:hypothetical protein|nr:hypothetical protein [Actinomycetota bacterium]
MSLDPAPGALSITATWGGTANLSISVDCGGASATQAGESGLYVTVNSPGGACSVTVDEPGATPSNVSYQLVIDYQKAA